MNIYQNLANLVFSNINENIEYDDAISFQGQFVLGAEIKQFADWLQLRDKSHKKQPMKTYIKETNIYQNLVDSMFHNINESFGEDESITFQAEFILTELQQPEPKLPKFPFRSEDWLGTNPKTDKTALNLKSLRTDKTFGEHRGKNVEFKSFIINLLPAKQSGFDMCMCASKACAATCLHTSGNIGGLVDKTVSRLRKSWAIVFDREKAVESIVNNIHKEQQRIQRFNNLPAGTWVEAKNTDNIVRLKDVEDPSSETSVRKSNYKIAIRKKPENFVQKLVIRLNGTSDLLWNKIKDKEGKTIFEEFPDVIFYDYTKHPTQMDDFLNKEDFPSNYHLTASYNGKWSAPIEKTLQNKGNVAVPFGPGKTSGLDYIKFPSKMEDLFKNLKYPENVTNKEQYQKEIQQWLEQNGVYCDESELSEFAGQSLLPGLFHCYEVVDGDHYDARFIDDHLNKHGDEQNVTINNKIHPSDFENKKYGLIIGLIAKGALTWTAYDSSIGPYGWDTEATGFMVGPADKGLNCDKPKISDPNKADKLIRKTEMYKKIAKAILLIRNHDARHLESGEKTHIQTKASEKPIQTYPTAKNRVDQELIDLATVFHAIFENKPLPQNIIKQLELKPSVLKHFEKLKSYISEPAVLAKLKDPNFIATSKEAGIGIDFNKLLQNLEQPKFVDATGQQSDAPLTLIPASTLQTLGKAQSNTLAKESFANWLLESEILQNLKNFKEQYAIQIMV